MAAITSAVVAAGATAYSANRAGKAAKGQARAADRATDMQWDIFQQQREDQAPWMEAGRNALTRLQDPQANFAAAPDYTFRRDEGMRGIEGSFAARGGAASGNALRALTEFNSNLASTEFGNWWNRQAGLAGIGQSATNTIGQAGQNFAANAGNSLIQGANARASGIQNQANIIGQGVNQLAGIYGYYNANRQPGISVPGYAGGSYGNYNGGRIGYA